MHAASKPNLTKNLLGAAQSTGNVSQTATDATSNTARQKMVLDLVSLNGRNLISEYNSTYRDKLLSKNNPTSENLPQLINGLVFPQGNLTAEQMPQTLAKLDCESVKKAADIICNKLPGVKVPSGNNSLEFSLKDAAGTGQE